MVFNENINYDFILLCKQGRTQLIYSTGLITEHIFEIFGRIARLLSPNCGISWQDLSASQELQTSGISSKAINKTVLHKPHN